MLATSALVVAPANNNLAYADETVTPKANTDGVPGLCTPTVGTMGDSNGNIKATDTGAATYVGGDMFIGKRSSDANMTNGNGNSGGGPDGSYAAEIEGATVVNGDLYAKLKKGFFTAGVAAFGSQFVPASGTQVLTVGGNTKTTAKPSSSSHAFAWKDLSSPAYSDTSRSAIGISDNATYTDENGQTVQADYTAAIAGGAYNLYGKDYAAVVPYSGNADRVNWNQPNPLSNITGLTNDTDDNVGSKTDFTGYGEYLKNLSKQMTSYAPTSGMTVNTTGTLLSQDPNDESQSYTSHHSDPGRARFPSC